MTWGAEIDPESVAYLHAHYPEFAPRLEKIKLIDYDFKKYGASTERKRLLARWDSEVGSLR